MQFDYATYENMKDQQLPSGVAWFLRHAERYPIEDMDHPDVAPLTEKGLKDSFAFGEKIARNFSIEHVFSSPVQRCIDTGKNLLEGAGIQQSIILKWWLYTPFLDLEPDQLDGKEIIQVRTNEFSHHIDLAYLDMILRRIKIPSQPNKINFYLTHDSTIMPVAARMLGKVNGQFSQFPKFLEGAALYRENDQLHLFTPNNP